MKNLLLLFFVLFNTSVFAQNVTSLSVVQEQLDAYNARDIDRFMAVFADSVIFKDFKTASISMKGKAAARERFADYFKSSPELQSNLAGRIHFDNVVIDHEKIIGSRGSTDIYELVMIYEVNKDGKIFRATSIRKN